jgi:hypothetical protein
MPRLARAAGPIGLALSAYDVWRRLPPRHRQLIARQVRKHGPRVVKQAVDSVRAAAASSKRL